LNINKSSFTFVTALYNIHREAYDKRSFAQYQEWFLQTLTVPVPMVIYTEEVNREIIERVRKNIPTKTIYTTLEEVHFYNTIHNVKHIIENTEFKKKIKHPNGLENTCYGYIPIIHNKFKWMMDAIENNYFNTEMFFWIDAGLSRFMDFDMAQNSFNTSLIDKLHTENKLYFQIGNGAALSEILKTPSNIHSYIGTNTNFIMAGFWGGNKILLYEICKISANLYISEFIEKEQVDNEQTLLGFILPSYQKNILFIKNTGLNYINYYVFCNKVLSDLYYNIN
jgi:hypothetical protein